MKNIIILCIVAFYETMGFSQNFQITSNIVIEKVTENEFKNAYKHRDKDIFRWKKKGKGYRNFVKEHLNTDVFRKIDIRGDYKKNDDLPMHLIKLKSNEYVLQETKQVLSNAYYIKEGIVDTTAMFGIGGVDNKYMYYASPDYDCDQHVWCRWYSFADGKVSIVAELEDKSFEYDFANYSLPFFFADNHGYYYIVICKNPNVYKNVDDNIFLKIKISQSPNVYD